MQQPPLVTVVMPTYNKSPETLALSKKALESVSTYCKAPVQMVVVDNASPAGCVSLAALREMGFVGSVVACFTVNQGFARACNVGFQFAVSEFVAQMNTDCELVEDSLSILIRVMRENCLAVSFPEHFENCAHYGLGKSPDLMGSDWRFGAFWVARTDAIRQVGGFDEGFEMCYFEDTDLWRRLEQRGHRLAGYRGTWVKHVGGASSIPERDACFLRNKKRYEEKWNIPSTT